MRTVYSIAFVFAIFVAFSFPAISASRVEATGWIEQSSPHDVATTVERLKTAIERGPATLFAIIDHRRNALGAGLNLPPATLVVFGNPNVGTPIMQADPRAGHDLPVRILVWSQNGTTRLTALSAAGMAARYSDIPPADESLQKMEKAVLGLMQKATAAND